MKKTLLLTLAILLSARTVLPNLNIHEIAAHQSDASLYNELQLAKLGLKEEVFCTALNGWRSVKEKQHIQNTGIISIADLSQSSNEPRFYVIDVAGKKVLFNTFVSHGRNSGELYAHSFSNKSESFKSSLGFYITQSTYQGLHGLSMKLKGIEKEINDDAEERGIVVHGAPYVSKAFIEKYGRLGRSQGCPAVPEELCGPIVNAIKDGSCLFMFYPDSTYFENSEFF